jgi:chromate transporter
LYNPVWTSAVLDLRDAAVALGCFLLLVTWRAPAWLVVALAAATGVLMTPV